MKKSKIMCALLGLSCLLFNSNLDLAAAEGGDLPCKENVVLYASFEQNNQPEINKTGIPIQWHGRTKIKTDEGITGKGAMDLDLEGYGEIDKTTINSKGGTIAFWFNTKGDPTGDTHTYISWGWKESGYPFMVFSQPWFEGDLSAGGPDRTYYVFLNTISSVSAFKTSIRKGEWVFYAITWEKAANNKMTIAAFQNGKEVASAISNKEVPSDLNIATPLFLGCDKGIPRSASKGRWMNGYINDLTIFDKALNKNEVNELFKVRYRNPDLQKKISSPDSWMSEMKNKPYREKRDKNGTLLESRTVFNGDGYAFDNHIERTQEAGFNVYMPEVGSADGLQCESNFGILQERYVEYKKQKSQADPYKNFIEDAHKRGIEVHSCFTVMNARPHKVIYPEYYLKGTTFNNGYDPKYRDLMVNIMVEHANRYNIDGLSLDYIRIEGGLDTDVAAAEYKRIYSRDLSLDRNDSVKMAEFTGYCVDDIVRRVSEGIHKSKPNVIISACMHCHTQKMGLPANGRNSAKWINKGWIDVAYNMDYDSILSVKLMDEARSEVNKPYALVEMVGNYDFIGGECKPRDPKLLADQIDYCRKKYNDGNGIGLYFSKMLSKEQIKALRNGPFKETAKPSWRRSE